MAIQISRPAWSGLWNIPSLSSEHSLIHFGFKIIDWETIIDEKWIRFVETKFEHKGYKAEDENSREHDRTGKDSEQESFLLGNHLNVSVFSLLLDSWTSLLFSIILFFLHLLATTRFGFLTVLLAKFGQLLSFVRLATFSISDSSISFVVETLEFIEVELFLNLFFKSKGS